MFNGIMLASGFCSGSHHCKSSVVLEHHFQIFFLWHLVSALGEIHPPSGADQTTKCIYHSWHTFCIDGYSKHPCISQLQSTLWFLVVSTLLAAARESNMASCPPLVYRNLIIASISTCVVHGQLCTGFIYGERVFRMIRLLMRVTCTLFCSLLAGHFLFATSRGGNNRINTRDMLFDVEDNPVKKYLLWIQFEWL